MCVLLLRCSPLKFPMRICRILRCITLFPKTILGQTFKFRQIGNIAHYLTGLVFKIFEWNFVRIFINDWNSIKFLTIIGWGFNFQTWKWTFSRIKFFFKLKFFYFDVNGGFFLILLFILKLKFVILLFQRYRRVSEAELRFTLKILRSLVCRAGKEHT